MYCKVGFKRAAKDAWAMMRGSRAVIFMSLLASVVVFSALFFYMGGEFP